MAQAHAAGIVHRDLKPSNLFLAEEAGKRVLKVLDFGISKIAPDAGAPSAATSTCMTVGTPLYMSPEQMRSSKDVDGRSDIWSLGVILYELVAGTPPFLGTTTAAIAAIVADAMPSLRRVRPDVPEALERVLLTALAKVPADRLPTAEALGAALLPFASADGVAGPFSLRPSQRDFALAISAMARTPTSQRVSDATELLELRASRPPSSRPSSRPSRRPSHPRADPHVAKDPSSYSSREALRAFAGSIVIGMGLASAMAVVLSRPAPSTLSSDPLRVIVAPTVRHAEAPPHARPAQAEPPVRLIATSNAAFGPDAGEAGVARQSAQEPRSGPMAELATRRRSLAVPVSPTPAAATRRTPPPGAGLASGASGLRRAAPSPSPYM